MNCRVFFTLLVFSASASADPGFSLANPETIEVCWAGESGKQYGLFCSSDLESWELVGDRLLGIDGTMSAQDDIRGAPQKFYRVEEFSDILLDVLRMKFSTVGNKWVYSVETSNILGAEFFTWETEILQRTVSHQLPALEI